MKKILGLDLGTNSIGWAVVNAQNDDNEIKLTGIEAAGSRIIPMNAQTMDDFQKGNPVSQTKDRTQSRGTRRLRERELLRRSRLLRVLSVLDFLPKHYADSIDKYGNIVKGSEPKIAWSISDQGENTFLFKDSYNQMLEDFRKSQPELVSDGKKVPYDWTIYYLRKKALSEAITKEELSWILLNFNQKRGYYQLRGEEEDEKENQNVEFYSLKVVSVTSDGPVKDGKQWYNVTLENGWVYRRQSSLPLDWEGKTKDFIVTTDLNPDGSVKLDKEGNEKRKFRAPQEGDWTLLKKKTEYNIENSKNTVGQYIYENILNNPDQKIRGKLVRTIERKYYRAELQRILDKQKEFIPELSDEKMYKSCIEELYSNNDDFRNSISRRDFTYLFVDNILFYQRPLKSKKSSISNCPYETTKGMNGEEYPIKCAAKSNPYFQEFRLWQFISNLRIYAKEKEINGKLMNDVDVTSEFIGSENDIVKLYEWMNDRKEVKQEDLLKTYLKVKKSSDGEMPYRWNYVEDKTYPCNKTRHAILSKLTKDEAALIDNELLYKLWHLLYSVKTKAEIDAVFTAEKKESGKGIYAILSKKGISDQSIEKLKKVKFDEEDYGSYSEKAIKKLLPLMRVGSCWQEDNIHPDTKDRIEKIITGEYDENIKERVREKTINLSDISQFRGLPLWLACYVVYDRHSEASDVQKWEKPEDIDKWLDSFKQHSLNNPIVEQVVCETMRTVRDIWKHVSKIDEIHLELAREMKNPADKRAQMTSQINDNENTNLRIKAMLQEFMNPEYNIDNVRPYSPSQQDLLKIYEDYALSNLDEKDANYEFVSKISKNPQPTKAEITRYKLWLEQQYRSPYTGCVIPLAKLFTPAYEIEHVIPQSRYFDDSFSNKVICESEVNKRKDSQLGYEFIQKHGGEIIQLSGGATVTILKANEYQNFVSKHYGKNKAKMKKLLMDEIPDGFIERQLNDSRYISKYIKGILSNIVREKLPNGELEQEPTSKNLIACNGSITDRLKKDWGMNDVWNRIILPRFKRLNEITGTSNYTTTNTSGEEIPAMPLEQQKGFNKKRIDHRHHAMDAIVIACTTRNHVNLLNNESAMSKNQTTRQQLSHKLRRYEEAVINGEKRRVPKEFIKPWETFTTDAQKTLENIIVSFKQNLRVINKTTNYYEHYVDGKKKLVKQEKGDSWAIRKPLHKESVFGEVNLRFIKEVSLREAVKRAQQIVEKDLKLKVLELRKQGMEDKAILKYFDENKEIWQETTKKVKIYYYSKETNDRYFASRFGGDLVSYFAKLKKYEDAKNKIESITDTGIQKILLAHLEANNRDCEVAFSPDGIDTMNKNIISLNGGKYHKPIYTIRKFEKGNRFSLGQSGNNSKKYMEAQSGTNLFFAVYESHTDKKRTFVSIPLNMVIDCQKTYKEKWRQNIDILIKKEGMTNEDDQLLFILSPGDLVYIPMEGKIDPKNIYKMVSSSGKQCFFVLSTVAQVIIDKVEFSALNKMERSIEGEMIKEICHPLIINRIGTQND